MKLLTPIILLCATALSSCVTPVRDVVLSDPSPGIGTLDDAALTLLVWNIEKKSSNSAWLAEFIEIHETEPFDLALLQEASLTEELRELLTRRGFGWEFAPNLIGSRGGAYSGVLTASSAAAHESSSLSSIAAEPIVGTPKSVIVTRFTLSDDTVLLIANIHAVNFVGIAGYENQLLELEKKLARHDGPIILAGDFNTWSGRRLALLVSLSERLGLRTVTFSREEARALVRFPLAHPLDHVLYRGLDVVSESANVLVDSKSSDHRPIRVTFRIAAGLYDTPIVAARNSVP